MPIQNYLTLVLAEYNVSERLSECSLYRRIINGGWNVEKHPEDTMGLSFAEVFFTKKWAHELWRSRVSHGNIPLLFFMCKVSAVHKVCKGCPAMRFYVCV